MCLHVRVTSHTCSPCFLASAALATLHVQQRGWNGMIHVGSAAASASCMQSGRAHDRSHAHADGDVILYDPRQLHQALARKRCAQPGQDSPIMALNWTNSSAKPKRASGPASSVSTSQSSIAQLSTPPPSTPAPATPATPEPDPSRTVCLQLATERHTCLPMSQCVPCTVVCWHRSKCQWSKCRTLSALACCTLSLGSFHTDQLSRSVHAQHAVQ